MYARIPCVEAFQVADMVWAHDGSDWDIATIKLTNGDSTAGQPQ